MAGLEVRDRAWVFDFVFTLVVSLLTVAPMASQPVIAAASAVLCSSLMFRRRLPALALGLGVAGALGLLVVGARPVPAIVVVPLLIYGLARWSSGPYGRIAMAAGLLGALLGPLVWLGVSGTYQAPLIFGMTALASAAIVLGAYLLGSRRRESRLREQERRAGASGFLLKDTRPDELLSAIRQRRGRGRRGRPERDPPTVAHVVPRLGTPAPTGPDPRMNVLTAREIDVLREIAAGATNAEIGARLYLAEGTVKTHIGRLLAKLEIRDRVGLVLFAYDVGLVS